MPRRPSGLSVEGPSPRVRGSLDQRDVLASRGRSIPACAGKPREAQSQRYPRWVHPRVCGEADADETCDVLTLGPSPRVRGSPARPAAERAMAGSIPACAGKPAVHLATVDACKVHPRVCGEAVMQFHAGGTPEGPSPRVRGSPDAGNPGCFRAGSIPACAGKPRRPTSMSTPSRVHPRVCGEATTVSSFADHEGGPSPRVRGSHRLNWADYGETGSIPACAGKPTPGARRRDSPTVHPRVCGEARDYIWWIHPNWGPSPRVRGSLRRCNPLRWTIGSIPACAGKPRPPPWTDGPIRVHPRVCGEAAMAPSPAFHPPGPSPRVRGSPDVHVRIGPRYGSIPACAGKPCGAGGGRLGGRVHPRVCGEAVSVIVVIPVPEGPSPRVRGSPLPWAWQR